MGRQKGRCTWGSEAERTITRDEAGLVAAVAAVAPVFIVHSPFTALLA